jgi:hypothetical protein
MRLVPIRKIGFFSKNVTTNDYIEHQSSAVWSKVKENPSSQVGGIFLIHLCHMLFVAYNPSLRTGMTSVVYNYRKGAALLQHRPFLRRLNDLWSSCSATTSCASTSTTTHSGFSNNCLVSIYAHKLWLVRFASLSHERRGKCPEMIA